MTVLNSSCDRKPFSSSRIVSVMDYVLMGENLKGYDIGTDRGRRFQRYKRLAGLVTIGHRFPS